MLISSEGIGIDIKKWGNSSFKLSVQLLHTSANIFIRRTRGQMFPQTISWHLDRWKWAPNNMHNSWWLYDVLVYNRRGVTFLYVSKETCFFLIRRNVFPLKLEHSCLSVRYITNSGKVYKHLYTRHGFHLFIRKHFAMGRVINEKCDSRLTWIVRLA